MLNTILNKISKFQYKYSYNKNLKEFNKLNNNNVSFIPEKKFRKFKISKSNVI